MKNLIFLPFAVFLFLHSNLSAQSFKNIDEGLRVQHGDIIAADIDSDNDLDIIVSGDDHGGKSGVYINKKETGTFSLVPQTAPNPASYTNPVYNADAADPVIVKAADGWYYAYTTSNPFVDGSYHYVPVLRSKNLTQWDYVGDAFQNKAPWFVDPTYKTDNYGYWAPDVNYYNGKYYMYYSVASRTSNTQPTAIGLAESNSPYGPFEDKGMILDLTTESKTFGVIDPFLYIDNGTPYLFFGSFDGIYGYQMNTDLKTKAGTRFQIAGNSFEGAYIKKHGSYYYFIASSGDCCNDPDNPYHLTVARSANLNGPYVNASGQDIITNGIEGKMLLQQNAKWLNPGHNANIITDDNGSDFLLYHAIDDANRQIGSTGAPRRVLMMDKITWNNDWPEIVGNTPSQTSQTSPVFGAFGSETSGASKVITPGHFADIKMGDINGDGLLDAIWNGHNSTNNIGIALGQGNGVFANSSAYTLSTATISNGFADFDNNGLLDYYQTGNQGDQTHLYYQQTDGSFTHTSLATDYWDPDITLVDFNNDGWVDIFLTAGWDDNISARAAGVYINNNGSFGATYIPVPIRKGYGSASWADIDNDGYLDLLLNGDGGTDGEGSNDIYRLYKNNNGTLESVATFNDYRQISVGDGGRLIDWDNDGDLDIILTGWSGTKGRQVTMLFECTNATNFTYTENALSNTDFPGVSESSIETADLNNDGKIDLLITGFNGDQASQVGKYNRNISGYYLNQSVAANAVPSAPSNLQALANGTDITLSWDAATDDHTPTNSLSYNIYLKNTTLNQWFIYPMSKTTTGYREIPQLGNVYLNKSWTIKGLPDGNYEWSVQAIDANFMGGAFASAQNFTIETTTGVKNIKNNFEFISSNNALMVRNKTGLSAVAKVYSISGGLLSESVFTSNTTFNLSAGIYIVEINVNGVREIQKVSIK